MKIGIIGAGNVALKLTKLLANADHEVFVGSRAPHNEDKIFEYSKNVRIGSIPEAANFGEIVIVAIPYPAVEEVLLSVSETLSGKIVIDATNPLNDDWSPIVLPEGSAGEKVALLLPESKIVKAFNTIFADVMDKASDFEGKRITAFYCGDDKSANKIVGALLKQIGFQPIEAGEMKNAHYLEAMAHLNIHLAVAMKGGTNAAFNYIRG